MDRRAYQHGVRLLKDHEDTIWAIWSSSPGNPPEGQKKLIRSDGSKCSYFTHDIFYSSINPDHPVLHPQLLVSMPEAQEPVDAAVSSSGSIAITFEDGSDSDTRNCDGVIEQRYKIFTHFPERGNELRTVQIDGAHSGHIASVGNNFVIAYAEGWIEGEGAFDGGTANDIYVETFSQDGDSRHFKPVARDKGWPRDWWPLIAGSSKRALLIWQRLVTDSRYASLMATIYDPENNKIVKPIFVLKENLQYYHFDAQFLPAVNRFLVVGNYLGTSIAANSLPIVSPKLFAILLDESGEVIDSWESNNSCTPCGSYPVLSLVRETRPAIINNSAVADVLYPIKPNGIVWFTVTQESVAMKNVFHHQHMWFPLGADGIFLDKQRALFINLTPTGTKIIKVSIP